MIRHIDNIGTNCYEGNLDVQYIMGLAQKTATYFWYVGSKDRQGKVITDPFLHWAMEAAHDPHLPMVTSISFAAVEQVQHYLSVNGRRYLSIALLHCSLSVLIHLPRCTAFIWLLYVVNIND
jgi:hypothetical protein